MSTPARHQEPASGASDPASPLPALRLDQLQAFVILAGELNFRRAGQRLFLGQPGMSRRVRALERAVGRALFTRTGRSVALTIAGEQFLPHATEIVRIARAAIASVAINELELKVVRDVP